MIKLKIDHTLVIDNALTEQECDALITEFNVKLNEVDAYTGYEHKDIFYDNNILTSLVNRAFDKYTKTFPLINQTLYKWQLQAWRFKRFSPGFSFNTWHSEHTIATPHRILACILYLSDHNCGTEFMGTNETVLSKKGRLLMFPAFWTHIHRGQICPDNKERFVMSAYVEMLP
jgi:hypothetical protein